MNACSLSSVCRGFLIGTGIALASPPPGVAADNAPPETLYIKVFPDHYVAAGKRFPDLAALEAWARPILIRSVWLDFCYPATTGQLVSAIERIHSMYPRGMQIRTLSSGEEGCASTSEPASSAQANNTVKHADAE